MKSLFEKNDADFCTLIGYVQSFVDDKSDTFQLFQLPPIQRNAVWNVAQIERLWDSLLRGFPIGSFLVSPRKREDKARDLFHGIQKQSGKEGYFLLDGQQRTRALLLGFKPNENARLWIDLMPQLNFNNAELNDREFLLRVVTSHQPWGMSDRNPTDKLSEDTKLRARNELGITNIHYDYQVKIDNGSTDPSIKTSWPYKANLPVPLDALITLCGGMSGRFVTPEWEQVRKLIPERYFQQNKVPDSEPEHLSKIIASLQPLLEITNPRLRARTIVLLFQHHEETLETNDPDVQDDMEVLFRRVNAGGTRLEGEEMAYSLLKSAWDGAYEMVTSIVEDPKVGYLLPPTGIVMAATRIARFMQEKIDDANPGIGNFRKWIGDSQSHDSFLANMRKLLQKTPNGKSLFHQVMQQFCNVVLYRPDDKDDIGIPKKLLLTIKSGFYHPVLIWIFKIGCKEEIVEQNRTNILRYLLYCYLAVDKHDKASKKAIEEINISLQSNFPDHDIYKILLEEELGVSLPDPSSFSKPFENEVDGFLRHWNDLFNLPDDPYNILRQYFWDSSRDLLLWYQRSFTVGWFPGYDPASNDAFDTPYDWDHIMPYSHLITSGRSAEIYTKDKDSIDKFFWSRHLYVNSIGNLRLWPYWANRSDNNICHTYKLRMEEADFENDPTAKELHLLSTEDFLLASVIPLEDMNLWYEAGGEPRDWPQERRVAWQKAVERRACYLYSMFYSAFEFKNWKSD